MHSPLFAQTLAYAYQAAGHLEEALHEYRSALRVDPTFFPAENDSGVILARLGRTDEAEQAFRRAVGAKPDYPLGWFNLGVLLSGMGPIHYLEAQGAFGRAAQLDGHLRDRERQLTFDTEPYNSGLDLSRPLPSDWRFAEYERRAPATLTALVVLLLIVRLLWSLGLDQVAGAVGSRLLGRGTPRWRRVLGHPIVPQVAIAATVGLLLWPLLGAAATTAVDVAALGVGAAGVVGAYLRSRTVASRWQGEQIRHFTWLPAIAFGAAMTGVGLAFAPVPAAQTSSTSGRVRWAGPAALAIVTVALLALGAVTAVPATRTLAASSLVMIGSVLLPVKPYDGAYLTGRLTNLAVSLALAAAGALLLLGWI